MTVTSSSPKILFITSTRIGDVVLSSGIVHALLERSPGSRLTIAGGEKPIRLFRDTPGLEALIPLIKRKRGGHWIDLWRRTRGTRWDEIVDLRGSVVSRTLRARRRSILERRGKGRASVHKVLEAARVVGMQDQPPAPFFSASERSQARADEFLDVGGPLLAVAPAANWIGKAWPAERFAALVTDLLGHGGFLQDGRLLLLGGEEDRATTDVVAAAIGPERVVSAVGFPSLLTTYAMLRRARLFVGNDSGMMHLAAAAGAPTLGLFGPTDDRLYAPWGEHSRVVRGET